MGLEVGWSGCKENTQETAAERGWGTKMAVEAAEQKEKPVRMTFGATVPDLLLIAKGSVMVGVLVSGFAHWMDASVAQENTTRGAYSEWFPPWACVWTR